MIETEIKKFSAELLENLNDKKIQIIGHYDSDGISSTAIISKTLERLEKQFSLKIVKQLTEKEILSLPKDKIIIFLDLGSGSIEKLKELKNTIFIIDHHEISNKEELKEIKNIKIINPTLIEETENLCTSELSYLISREISSDNIDLAYLAIIGMIGDVMDRQISKIRNKIIKDAKVIIKKGLLVYPSTRPIDRTLEYSSKFFIPGVTGDKKGAYELLKEAGIEKIGKNYKSLIDFSNQEMKKLVTTIMLRVPSKEEEYIGNIYLIKFFNKIEDVREISAIINACSRMDEPETALLVCLGNFQARKKAERIYIKYRQQIISGLRYVEKDSSILGEEYIIINAKDNIKDTIIGTIASILSFSSIYDDGKIIIAMAYSEDKIKVSARISGKNKDSNVNLKELMDSLTEVIGGESGGHKMAAGCLIDKKDEEKFIDMIKKRFEYEVIKVKNNQNI